MSEPFTGVEMVGPFSDGWYKVTHNGYLIPYIQAMPVNAQGTAWHLLLDDRMSYALPQDFLESIIPLLADSMAIAAGWKSHAVACAHQGERYNPFGTRLMKIASLPDEEEQPA